MKTGELIWVKLPHMERKVPATVVQDSMKVTWGGQWVDVLIEGKIKGIHCDFIVSGSL
tara:strand:+ start:323 stop:496 length:174 start_codon:yes stop_codon:yes gene_type:complete